VWRVQHPREKTRSELEAPIAEHHISTSKQLQDNPGDGVGIHSPDITGSYRKWRRLQIFESLSMEVHNQSLLETFT